MTFISSSRAIENTQRSCIFGLFCRHLNPYQVGEADYMKVINSWSLWIDHADPCESLCYLPMLGDNIFMAGQSLQIPGTRF